MPPNSPSTMPKAMPEKPGMSGAANQVKMASRTIRAAMIKFCMILFALGQLGGKIEVATLNWTLSGLFSSGDWAYLCFLHG